MSELIIRSPRADELAAVFDLTRRAYAEYATIMDAASWAALSGAIDEALASPQPVERVVAVADGVIVGSAMLYPPATRAYGELAGDAAWPEVRLVAVDPDARGRGVAKALVAECIRRARSAGATDVGLHTSRSMAAAMRMYQRMGFERAPEHDFQPAGAERVEGYRLRLG